MTRRSDSGQRGPSDRRHVAVTVPQPVRDGARQAAALLDWSVGDWVLAMAAEHGPAVTDALAGQLPARRRAGGDVVVTVGLYLTTDERDELDEIASSVGLNRSAFVTAVAQLGLGAGLDEVMAPLQPGSRDPA